MLFASACAWAIGPVMLDVVSIATMMSARAGRPSRDRVLLTVVEVPGTRVVVTGLGVSVSAGATGFAAAGHRTVAARAAVNRMGNRFEPSNRAPLAAYRHRGRPMR